MKRNPNQRPVCRPSRAACLPPPNTHERMPALSLNVTPPCLSTARKLSRNLRAHPKSKHNTCLTTPKRNTFESDDYVVVVVTGLDVFFKLIWMENHCESRRSLYQILVVHGMMWTTSRLMLVAMSVKGSDGTVLTFEKDRRTTTMTTESVFSQWERSIKTLHTKGVNTSW